MHNSRKKYAYAGQKETADTRTGEIERSTILVQKRQDLNFVKIFLPERGYLMFPKELTTSAREVFEYLLVVHDKQNMAIAPTLEIKDRLGISEASICRGRKQLLKLDFIRQRGQGVFMVNPTKSVKVDGDKREELYMIYEELKSGKGE